MADNFTGDQVQGVFGKFVPVLDQAGGDPSANNVQGVLGRFKPVLDEVAGAGVTASIQVIVLI